VDAVDEGETDAAERLAGMVLPDQPAEGRSDAEQQ